MSNNIRNELRYILPKHTFFTSVPKMIIYESQNSTWILNIDDLCSFFNRDRHSFIDFFRSKFECTVYSSSKNSVITKIISDDDMRIAYTEYVDKLVLCKKCKKLNTSIVNKKIRCNNCG